MKKANFMKKISLILAVCMMVTLLVPVLAFAASTAQFYYNTTTGKLSGSVYVNDMNKVKVTIFDSVYQPTVLPITELLPNIRSYDDKNHALQLGSYTIDLGVGKTPSKIEVGVCNQTISMKPYIGYSNEIQSYTSFDSWRIGPYRTTGKEHFTDYPIGQNVPAGAKLVEFTPNIAGNNVFSVELPYGISTAGNSLQGKVNNPQNQLSDYKLTDVTVGQSVYLNNFKIPYWYALQFETRDALITDHQYVLELSATSSGDELTLPTPGTYKFRIDLGTYDSKHYLDTNNRIYFDGLKWDTLTTDGMVNSSGIGAPYGDMTACATAPDSGGLTSVPDSSTSTDTSSPTSGPSNSGGVTSVPSATTPSPTATQPQTPTPDGGITDNGRGVKLSNGAATVTKETNADGKSVTKVVLDADKLGKALGLLKSKDQGAQTVSIEASQGQAAAKVILPASAIVASAKDTPNAIISIKSDQAVYDLPVNLLDLVGIAGQLGADLKDVTIHVTIEKVVGSVADQLSRQAQAVGIKLVGDAVDFSITVEANGKKQAVNTFGSTYVSRTLLLDNTVDSNHATVIMYDPATGAITFVPAVFTNVDGKTQVSIKRNGNSIYSVVSVNKTFADLNGHWAKADVERLASKLVVNGRTETEFAPEEVITRAEFASLIIRALGLTPDNSKSAFSDVAGSEWFAGAINAAVKAGVINGFEDGSFHPSSSITREQMAVMISRALAFGGKTDYMTNNTSSKFTDQASINAWAQPAVLQAANAGILNGMADASFSPQEKASRAQAAVVLKRLLETLNFIN